MGGLGYEKNIVVLGFSDDAQLGRLRLVSGACRARRASGTPWTSGTPGASWKSSIRVRSPQIAAWLMSREFRPFDRLVNGLTTDSGPAFQASWPVFNLQKCHGCGIFFLHCCRNESAELDLRVIMIRQSHD